MGNKMVGCKQAADNAWLRSMAISGLLLSLVGVSQQAAAATADEVFQQYITDICFQIILPPPGVTWDIANMCTLTSSGFAGAGPAPSVNLGTGNAGNRSALRNKIIRQSLGEEEKAKPKKKAASADGGGWGLLLAPQYSKSKRVESNLENGFNADLMGLGMGLDYRFSNRFVFGALVSHVKDKATFLNSAGKLDTKSNTLTMYGTWLPSDNFSVDGYLGYGQIKLDSERHVVFGTVINGIASGNTTGKQIMGGFSASYQRDFGRVNVSPFINLNSIKTTFDGYNETGTTTLELRFNERKSLSTTGSVGARASTAHGYRWGSLSPSVRVAAVHEYQNNAVQISNELVLTPGAGFLVATDSPDRNYLSAGAGVAAGLNNGTQLFLNYETRVKDKFLTSWAVSGGVLMEF